MDASEVEAQDLHDKRMERKAREREELARLTRELAHSRADLVIMTHFRDGLAVTVTELEAEVERLRAVLNSKPTPDAILLQARKPGGEWIDIFPAQLSWIAKDGFDVRALDGDG